LSRIAIHNAILSDSLSASLDAAQVVQIARDTGFVERTELIDSLPNTGIGYLNITTDGALDISALQIADSLDIYDMLLVSQTLTSPASSDAIINLPVPSATYAGKQITFSMINEDGGFDNRITGQMYRNSGNLTDYTVEEFKTLTLACLLVDATTYKWVFVNEKLDEGVVTSPIAPDSTSVWVDSGDNTIKVRNAGEWTKIEEKPTVYRLYNDGSITKIDNDIDVRINFKEPPYNDSRITGLFDHRLINTNYTGPAYTVENSVGDTLQVNFLSNEYGALPDTSAMLAFADTVYVKRWYNQKGNGVDFEVGSSVTGKGPYIVLNNVLQKENGQIALFFDGDGSALITSSDVYGNALSSYNIYTVANVYSSNFGIPASNTSIPTNGGFSLYYNGGNLNVNSSGYFIDDFSFAIYPFDSIAPKNTHLFNFYYLGADSIRAYKNNNLVTPTSIDTTPAIDPNVIGLLLGRTDNNAESNFWYFTGTVQQIVVSGQNILDLKDDIYSESNEFYSSGSIDTSFTPHSIRLVLEAAKSTNIGKEIKIDVSGEDGQILLTGGKFLNRGIFSDSLVLDASGIPTITLHSVAYQDTFAYKLSYPIVDKAVLDTINNKLYDTYVYASQEFSIESAITKSVTEKSTLVIDKAFTQSGLLDLKGLDLIFTKQGKLNFDTITASGASFKCPPRQIFGQSTIVKGDWDVEQSYIEWTVGDSVADSIANYIGLINAVTIGGTVKILEKDYRLERSVEFNTDKNIFFEGVNKENSILTLLSNSPYFLPVQNGSNVRINNITIKTLDYENNTANNNNSYVFVYNKRDDNYVNVVVDIGVIDIRNSIFLGEVSFSYGITGGSPSNPDSLTFVNSGISNLNIENNRFESVRDFLGIGNSFVRKAYINNNEVRNLSGAFIGQTSSLPDSLGLGYDISEFIMTNNTFKNDSTINYFGGGYFTPLVVKAQKVIFNYNTVDNLSKYTDGADVHLCYPSAQYYECVGNRIKNLWEKGEGSAFKFKGAREAKIIGNTFIIESDSLLKYGIIDTTGVLVDSSAYALSIIDKEDQFPLNKSIQMSNNDIRVPVLNQSTDIGDLSNLIINDNIFNIKYFQSEPFNGWTGDTETNSFFHSLVIFSPTDSTGFLISKDNVFNIEKVEGNYLNYISYGSPTVKDFRFSRHVEFSDTWNVNNTEINIDIPYSKSYINNSKVVGSGMIKVVKTIAISPENNVVENAFSTIDVQKSYVNNNSFEPIFNLTPNTDETYSVSDNAIDTLVLTRGYQNEWNGGWIASNYPVSVEIAISYIDTNGINQNTRWKALYTTSPNFRIEHYSNGGFLSYGPQNESAILIDQSNPVDLVLESIALPSASFGLRLSNLKSAQSFTVTITVKANNNINLLPIPSISNPLGGINTVQASLDSLNARDLGAVLTQGANAGGVRITNLADPVADQDAATKGFARDQDLNDADYQDWVGLSPGSTQSDSTFTYDLGIAEYTRTIRGYKLDDNRTYTIELDHTSFTPRRGQVVTILISNDGTNTNDITFTCTDVGVTFQELDGTTGGTKVVPSTSGKIELIYDVDNDTYTIVDTR